MWRLVISPAFAAGYYGAGRVPAQAMGESDAAGLLQENLKQEQATLSKRARATHQPFACTLSPIRPR
jgi:ferritin-like metal-binding protein YciE